VSHRHSNLRPHMGNVRNVIFRITRTKLVKTYHHTEDRIITMQGIDGSMMRIRQQLADANRKIDALLLGVSLDIIIHIARAIVS
jgi:hypothetical protein